VNTSAIRMDVNPKNLGTSSRRDDAGNSVARFSRCATQSSAFEIRARNNMEPSRAGERSCSDAITDPLFVVGCAGTGPVRLTSWAGSSAQLHTRAVRLAHGLCGYYQTVAQEWLEGP